MSMPPLKLIESKLKRLLGEQFGINSNDIKGSDCLIKKFGADSMDLLEITMTIEESFNISIEDDDFLKTSITIDDIINLISRKTIDQ